MSAPVDPFNSIYNILIVVTIITLLARRFNFPQTLAMIIAGIYSTFFTNFQLPTLESEIFITLLLPPILFQETLHLNVDDLLDDSDIILSYSIIGTIMMVISISLFSMYALNLGILESILMGVVIAPTDPVSVISSFQKMGVVKRFQLLVAGESLFNDGVAILIYSILLTSITVGAMSIYDVSVLAMITILGGVIIGVLNGYLVHTIFCWTDDKYVKVLLTFIVVFGGFKLTEELGSSGVLATVFSGLIINYRCKQYGGVDNMSLDMLDALWAFVGFIAQSLAFIFIGVNTDIEVLISYALPILSISAFIIIARYLMVVILAKVIQKTRNKEIPPNWILGITWSGLRGGVSVVLALGVDSLGLPQGEEILALTFGIVLLSNIIQGITMSSIAKILNLHTSSSSVNIFGDLFDIEKRYSPVKYKKNRSLPERMLFSFPEYLVNETRMGNWFSKQILNVLGWINIVMIKRIPKPEDTFIHKIINKMTDIAIKILNWISYYMEKNREE